MKYAALNYVKIAGQLYSRGEVIPGEILTDDQKDRLIRLNAIACVGGDEVIMPEPEVMSDDEAPEIDIMAGIVTEPEPKAPVKPKTGGRSRKK